MQCGLDFDGEVRTLLPFIYALIIFVTYFLSNSGGVFFSFTLIAVQPSVLSPLAKNNCTRLFRSNLKYFTQKNKQHRCVYVNMEVMQKKGYIFFSFGSYCVHKFLKSSRVKAEKCIVCIACAYSKGEAFILSTHDCFYAHFYRS